MVTIRPITDADEKSWRELFTEFGKFYDTEFSSELLDTVWGWIHDPDHAVHAMVATPDDSEEVIGFANYRWYPDTFTGGQTLCLDDLFVNPEVRRTGAASAMIDELNEISRQGGSDKIRWITNSGNRPARAFYDKLADETDWVTYQMDVD